MARITVETNEGTVVFEMDVSEFDLTKPIARSAFVNEIVPEVIKAQNLDEVEAK